MLRRHKTPRYTKFYDVGRDGNVTVIRQEISPKKKERRRAKASKPKRYVCKRSCPEEGGMHLPQAEPTESRYHKAKQKRIDKWSDIRDSLLQVGIDMKAAKDLTCSVCQRSNDHNVIRCNDCGPARQFCYNCLIDKHKPPTLHCFEIWQNGAFLPYCVEMENWKRQDGHNCENVITKSVVAVDSQGRQHRIEVEFCGCEPWASTLLRFGLWACSPTTCSLAVHTDLLDWLIALQMEANVSPKSFYASVKYKLPRKHRFYYNKEVRNVYDALIKETLSEYRLFKLRLRYLQHLDPALDNGTTCPGCYQVPSLTFSMDADFQLVRKHSSGRTASTPRHAGKFFLDQSDVDRYMDAYNDSSTTVPKDCSNFQAGNLIRSKKKNQKLDEKAVFGCVCRHDFPKYFLSLKYGERLGYPVYLLEKIIQEHTEVNLLISYDIGCLLKAHLTRAQKQHILDRIKIMVPIFHSYGHIATCQVLYNPRRVEGACLTDGENIERLWSKLGRFSKSTKEMTPENRIDLLTEALIHIGEKVKDNLGSSLRSRYLKALKVKTENENKLSQILQRIGKTEADVKGWIEQQVTYALQKKVKVPYTWQEEYALLLKKSMDLRNDIALCNGLTKSKIQKELEKVEIGLLRKEKQMKIQRWNPQECSDHLLTACQKRKEQGLQEVKTEVIERARLLHCMKKYAKGQAIAIRINKQLQKKEMTIKTKVQLLNDDCSIVPPLKFEDLKNVDGSAWTEILRESDDSTAIPMLIQNEAAEHYNMVCRAMEEIDLLSKEVRSVMLYYSAQHTLFVDLIPKLSGAGEKAAVIEEGLACEKEMMKFYDSMKDCVSCDINVPSFFTEFVHIGWNTGLDDIIREIENLDELTGHESSKSDESEISDIEDLSDEN